MREEKRVSIVIPCRNADEAHDCIVGCKLMTYENYDIILLPNDTSAKKWLCGVKQIATGDILPGQKRDLGVASATGEIIAFIDADAFPDPHWLQNAVNLLERDPYLAGVCGAGILPPGAGIMERAADGVLKIFPFSYRVKNSMPRFVDDYPTFNLILKKYIIKQAGGFDCSFLTGEDTLLCKKITHDLCGKILYHPDVLVYHHRRKLFRPFLKQMAVYGKHRGYFFKTFPETSRKLVYALPSIALGALCILGLLFLALYLL